MCKELRVLLVEDSEADALLVQQALEESGSKLSCRRVFEADAMAEALREETWDIVLSDYFMPSFNGLEAIQVLKDSGQELPIVIVSGTVGEEKAVEAMKLGAHDYVMKDNLIRLVPAVKRAILDIKHRRERREGAEALLKSERQLQESLGSLKQTMEGTVHAMAAALEMRDLYTSGHQKRVAALGVAIGQEMSLSQDMIDGIRMGGVLHDLGKIAVPAEILSKPARLSNLEYGIIQEHPKVGHDIIKGIQFPWPVAQIMLQHHERVDGSGYPQGLTGENTLLEARIIGVADVIEAMASHRPYRPALGVAKALEEIQTNMGGHYDSGVAGACFKLFYERGYKLLAAT